MIYIDFKGIFGVPGQKTPLKSSYIKPKKLCKIGASLRLSYISVCYVSQAVHRQVKEGEKFDRMVVVPSKLEH